MRQTADYCFAKAADCESRAKEASDKEIREFLVAMRDSWIAVANRVGMLAAGQEPPPLDDLPNSFEPSQH